MTLHQLQCIAMDSRKYFHFLQYQFSLLMRYLFRTELYHTRLGSRGLKSMNDRGGLTPKSHFNIKRVISYRRVS
jgi:hypothetical protein